MGRKKRAKAAQGSGNKKAEKFETRLATILLAKSLVTSPEESISIAEAIVVEIEESEMSREEAAMSSLEDYFSLTRKDAKAALSALFNLDDKDHADDSDDSRTEEVPSQRRAEENNDDEDSDDGEYIGEGECELCERFIRLTNHHLIPRSTWPRILPRLNNAAEALSKNDVHRAGLILGPGLLHLLEPLTISDNDRVAIKGLVQRTCSICGPCHSSIHNAYGNMSLATNFSTTELLLQDDKIYKYSKWASKQRPGKFSNK